MHLISTLLYINIVSISCDTEQILRKIFGNASDAMCLKVESLMLNVIILYFLCSRHRSCQNCYIDTINKDILH